MDETVNRIKVPAPVFETALLALALAPIAFGATFIAHSEPSHFHTVIIYVLTVMSCASISAVAFEQYLPDTLQRKLASISRGKVLLCALLFSMSGFTYFAFVSWKGAVLAEPSPVNPVNIYFNPSIDLSITLPVDLPPTAVKVESGQSGSSNGTWLASTAFSPMRPSSPIKLYLVTPRKVKTVPFRKLVAPLPPLSSYNFSDHVFLYRFSDPDRLNEWSLMPAAK